MFLNRKEENMNKPFGLLQEHYDTSTLDNITITNSDNYRFLFFFFKKRHELPIVVVVVVKSQFFMSR